LPKFRRDSNKEGDNHNPLPDGIITYFALITAWSATYSILCLSTTDDGTKGKKGFVTDALKGLLDDEKFDRVVAVGPAIMMKFIAKMTEPFWVKTVVSLNSITLDGTGLCGACRVSVGGKTMFTCVDGPEFDGHQVDFDLLLNKPPESAR
jgi:NAD(P)H-flavin reductase